MNYNGNHVLYIQPNLYFVLIICFGEKYIKQHVHEVLRVSEIWNVSFLTIRFFTFTYLETQ